MFRTSSRFLLLVIAWMASTRFAPAANALDATELALVVNRNIPAGRALAEFYAQQRNVPAGRIIEVSLPTAAAEVPAEEITPAAYDAQVVPAVREFLVKNHLERQVKCLVTFWGMPLRIAARSESAAEKAEGSALRSQWTQDVQPKIEHEVDQLEGLARSLDPTFHPITGKSIQQLAQRASNAMNIAINRIATMQDTPQRGLAFEQFLAAAERLLGSDAVALRFGQPAVARLAPKPPATQEAAAARERLLVVQRDIATLESGPQSAESRAKLRQVVREHLGLLAYGQVLELQASSLDATESNAALDSELALLWWRAYPKAKWQLNPLYWRYSGHVVAPGPVLMVVRLDGPSEPIVHNLIATSIRVEQQGLKGQAALDARGKSAANDPYAGYDQTIRHLATIIRAHSSMQVTLDDKEALFAPHSLKDIAIYCGWYSLRHYVPPGEFNPGAVGFHVASFELVSLHNADERGWVRGLMKDGVAATLGPVAEPYLQSFPPADEFFPLLLTGKPTLAEVYWRTCPWVSWMQTCLGDPLYRPFLKNPQLKLADLPEPLQAAAKE